MPVTWRLAFPKLGEREAMAACIRHKTGIGALSKRWLLAYDR